MPPELFTFRRLLPTDRAFVASTWVTSYKDVLANLALPRAWTGAHARVVDKLLDGEFTRTWVAAPPKDDHTILGWCCASEDVLHYVYVPKNLRGEGLAKALIAHAVQGSPDPLFVSHKWPFASRRYQFNPYLAAVDA